MFGLAVIVLIVGLTVAFALDDDAIMMTAVVCALVLLGLGIVPATTVPDVPDVAPVRPARPDPQRSLARMAVGGGIAAALALGIAVATHPTEDDPRTGNLAGYPWTGDEEPYLSSYSAYRDSPPWQAEIDLDPLTEAEPDRPGSADRPARYDERVRVTDRDGGEAEVSITGIGDPCAAAACADDSFSRIVTFTIRIHNVGAVPVELLPDLRAWAMDEQGFPYLPEQFTAVRTASALLPRQRIDRTITFDVPAGADLDRVSVALSKGRSGGSTAVWMLGN